jgi:hypothetical protein
MTAPAQRRHRCGLDAQQAASRERGCAEADEAKACSSAVQPPSGPISKLLNKARRRRAGDRLGSFGIEQQRGGIAEQRRCSANVCMPVTAGSRAPLPASAAAATPQVELASPQWRGSRVVQESNRRDLELGRLLDQPRRPLGLRRRHQQFDVARVAAGDQLSQQQASAMPSTRRPATRAAPPVDDRSRSPHAAARREEMTIRLARDLEPGGASSSGDTTSVLIGRHTG